MNKIIPPLCAGLLGFLINIFLQHKEFGDVDIFSAGITGFGALGVYCYLDIIKEVILK